jgi:hypothetical protein
VSILGLVTTRRYFLLSGIALGLAPSAGAAVGQTDAEAAAGIVPFDPAIPPGDVRRYGALLDGTSDDTAALRAWARVGGELTFPAATACINGSISLSSHTSVTAAAGATIVMTVPDASFLTASGQSSIAVRGLHFRQSQAGAEPYVAGVLLDRCTRCVIQGNEFEALQWAGVHLLNSSDCLVHGNRFYDWQGNVQDSADICVYQASSDNLIDGNELNGGGCHGILCQDPYAGLVPRNNTFSGNRVGRHTTYGITVYCPGPGGGGDSNNKIIGNEVRDIQGSFYRNPSSGAGIYVVGSWAGGTQVSGNRIDNCCVSTQQRSLAPAGIGLAGISSSATPPVLSDNKVTGMTQGDGILVVSSPGGCSISGGSIEIPETNTGTGRGGMALLGSGIRVENSSHVQIHGVHVVEKGRGNALFVYAHQLVVEEVVVRAGEFSSGDSAATVRVEGDADSRLTNVSMDGTRATATADGPALHIAGLNGGRLSNVDARSRTQPALDLLRSHNLRISGGSYAAPAAAAMRIAGDCSGSVIDRSVNLADSAAGLDNQGRGFQVE